MNKRISLRAARLMWLLFSISFVSERLQAVEFREPLTLINGPLRYLFEDSSEESSLRVWSGAYGKFATKAYSNEHGRHFIEIPELMFLKSEFRPCHIFEDCLVKLGHDYYNPLLRTAKLRLRADYTEVGAIIGLRWDYPFATGSYSGRIGIRAQLPFKRCVMKKNDNGGTTSGSSLEDVLIVGPMKKSEISATTSISGSAGTTKVNLASVDSPAVRLDLMEALVQSPERNSFLDYNHKPTTGSGPSEVFAGSAEASVGDPTAIASSVTPSSSFGSFKTNSDSVAKSKVALIWVPEGQSLIKGRDNYALCYREDKDGNVDGSVNENFRKFPGDANIKGSEGTFVFGKEATGDTVYKNLADEASKSVEQRVLDQDSKANVWVIPFATQEVASATDLKSVDRIPATSVVDSARVLTAQIGNNAYDVLKDRNLVFESYTIDHVGDLQTELFMEFGMSDVALIEVNATLVAPTAGKHKYPSEYRSCYEMATGNGGHWEIAPGGRFAYRLGKYGSINLDGKYHFVLNETEKRPAAYKNSLLKNLGDPIDADVKWEYFVGKATINLTHPGSAGITGTVGYEFFYKRKEKIKFLQDTHVSMMGNLSVGNRLEDGAMNLSNEKAAENTNSISHRLVFEASYLLSDWVEFFWGGAWTFAGRNVLVSMDSHAGFHVAF